MSMTDPIADFLTRIRNGLHADHDDVEMPASKFKAELARILREQGYIEDYEVEPARVGRVLRVTPEVHRGPQARDPGHRARLEAGPPRATWTPGRSRRCRAAWAPRSSPPPAA